MADIPKYVTTPHSPGEEDYWCTGTGETASEALSALKANISLQNYIDVFGDAKQGLRIYIHECVTPYEAGFTSDNPEDDDYCNPDWGWCVGGEPVKELVITILG